MALLHPNLLERVSAHRDGLRVLVMLVAVLAAMAVLTVAFGVTHTGPSYELVPDPAAGLPF
ncbi:MAG TPA: hypothetical protein VHM48_07405 [Candidatus Limnocylindrales bacterium]|nr:hypothetical protein [Candidatus Limnocylindrales bacterium]